MKAITEIQAQIQSVDEAIARLVEIVLPHHEMVSLEKTIKHLLDQIQAMENHQVFLMTLVGENPCGSIGHAAGSVKFHNKSIKDSLHNSYKGFKLQHSTAKANQLKLDEMCSGQVDLKLDYQISLDLLKLARSNPDKFISDSMNAIRECRENKGSK